MLVNGKFAVDEGRRTGALPGVVLDKNEIRPGASGHDAEGQVSIDPSQVRSAGA